MMIDAKSFMEFFEKEYGVTFVDGKTGRKALEVAAENAKSISNPYNDPAYKSDNDRFLEEEEECSMKILVDADSCPVKQIIVRLAKQRDIPVIMLFDTAHEYSDGYSEVIIVDKQADSVDFALIALLTREDIVVTQDYGLAVMALGKGAKAINQNGLVFTDENIDKLLMDRHIGQKVRRSGGRTKGPSKRTNEDDARFEAEFESLLSCATRGRSL